MIHGPNIILRAPEMEDLQVIYRWENDPALQVVTPHFHPVSAFTVEQYILNCSQDPFVSGELRFMASRITDGQVVGHLDLFECDPKNRRAGLGIMIDTAFRRKGYALEMLTIVSDYCKTMLEMHQLWCTIGMNNQASYKLFLKAGFIQTGIRKEWNKSGNLWSDELFLQKLL